MSSINQAKAEAQKLIRRYNKLQAEAKTANTAEEAARKATETEKVISQISALQLAITKLQAKDKPSAVKKTVTGKKTFAPSIQTGAALDKSALSERMNHLEEAQKRTRIQIEQLNRAKTQLAHLKQRAEKSAAHVVQQRHASDEKLQQELAKLIKKKEAEHHNLRQELDAIRQQAKKEAELLKVQRDAARAMMETQKQREKEQSLASLHQRSHKGLLMGVVIGIIFSLIFIGILISLPPKKQEPIIQPRSANHKIPIENQETIPIEKQTTVPKIKVLGKFREKLKSGYGPKMVKLSGGTFRMGSKLFIHSQARPQLELTLRRFSISQYEITFDEYDLFAKATDNPLPEDMGWGRGKRPVINVNWREATKYTEWLTEQTNHKYRLPSEREWEYAASAGIETRYWWGNNLEQNQANCGVCGSDWDGQQTSIVGRFSPNPLGLYDTIGNVMEWTDSCVHHNYQGAPSIGQKWEGGNCSLRVVRGSSYMSGKDALRISKRILDFSTGVRLDTLGFRVVRID
ncbi:MAG: hypothetical protein DRQ49_11435 [Gammaproteobacteria bacterium]|nr:MAG: hypothetical protein DRQ49_11435 [Gammaproteobacteria bacterium]RKZ73178.1 MAG: hypothetical protein DRQ57_15210 [Gammaproteobacteria bacterium]